MINECDYKNRGWEVLPSFSGDPILPFELLQEMENDPQSEGKSSWGTRNILLALILSMRPKIVLEIGAHIGSASLVIGAGLKANGFGRSYCLEPQDHYFSILQDYIVKAKLTDFIFPMKKFSTDPQLLEILEEKADLIFLDASHTYSHAYQDLQISYDLLADNGIIVLDDAGLVISPQMCQEGKGGVRQALLDFSLEKDNINPIFFEPPFWLNPCGMAIVCKQNIKK